MNEQLPDEERCLPPWKAFVGIVVCSALSVLIYHLKDWSSACATSGLTGMFVQDWVYRLRDKYDPKRQIGNV